MSVLIKGMEMPKSCKGCDLLQDYDGDMYCPLNNYLNFGDIENVPDYVMSGCPLSAQPEPLTDKEQRIFLAAMGREEKVCEEVDRNLVREPYEDTLVRVCKEIIRKVKGAIWT